MLKRIIFMFLAFSLSVSLMAACGRSQSKRNSERNDLASTVDSSKRESDKSSEAASSADVKITANVPEGWVKKEDSSTLLYYEKDTALFNVTTPWYPSETKSAADMLNYEEKMLKKSFEENTFYEPVSLKIDGMDAMRLDMDFVIGKTAQKQIYVYVFKNNKGYKIMGAAFTEDEQYIKEIEAIIDTIKFE